MGCIPSKPDQSPAMSVNQTKLHQLVRPDHYKEGKRPSFYAAYARAARRYGFEATASAGFAKRNNVVVKVKSKHDKDTEHEVPAESIQNGEPITRPACCAADASFTQSTYSAVCLRVAGPDLP